MNTNERYLSNPLFLNLGKVLSFEILFNKIKYRINMWKIPLLSQVGRSNLVKHVASAIPVYKMVVLKPP